MYISKSLSRQFSKLTATKDNILILGEPGVGKRTIAQEIQSKSTKGKPLVIDGLTAVDADFQALSGRLTIANIDTVSPHNQHLLARVLKETPGARVVLTAVRADGLNLDTKAFQRLDIQPLRNRLEELPDLARSIADRIANQFGKSSLIIDDHPLRLLSKSSWPGNLKQLVDVIGQGVLISHGDRLELPSEFLNERQHLEAAIQNITAGRMFILDQTLDLVELLLMRRALDTYQYNQTKVAEILGLSEANFRYRLKKFGLPSVRKVK
jgi:DNA-binding NtrC family response regulator